MDTKYISRGFKATFGGRILYIVASGLLMAVLTRFLLTNAEFGLLGTALAVLGIAQLFSDLGLAKSAARYVAEYREKDPGQVPHVLRSALVYRLTATAIISGGFVVFGGYIASLLGEPELGPLLTLGAGFIVTRSLFTFSQVVFQGYSQVTYSAIIKSFNAVLRLGLTVVFVTLIGGALGALTGYIVGFVVAAGLGLCLLYFRCYRSVEPADEPTDGLSRRVLKYSIPLTATRGADVLDKQVDTILVGYFMNPVAVSYYYLSKNIVGFLQTPAASLGFTLSPIYGKEKAGGGTDQAARLYETALEYTLLLYVPGAAGVILVAEPALRLIFGETYAPAAPVLQVLGVYVVLEAISHITIDALDYLGRARVRAYAKGVTSIANVLLNLVFIPAFGVKGAAAATVITYSGYVAANLAIIHKELSLSVNQIARHLAATVLVTGSMSIAVHAVLTVVSGPFAVVAAVLSGVVVWGTLSVAGGLLDVGQVTAVLSASSTSGE